MFSHKNCFQQEIFDLQLQWKANMAYFFFNNYCQKDLSLSNLIIWQHHQQSAPLMNPEQAPFFLFEESNIICSLFLRPSPL